MIEVRPVLFVVGLLLSVLSAVMLVPAVVDLAMGYPDWRAFVFSATATLFVGGGLVLSTQGQRGRIGLRQAFLMTGLCWLAATIFAALPFRLTNLPLSYTDAFFEAMSGITTTGSTVMIGLDHAPPGILLWRALIQWLGGIGIIVTAIAVLRAAQLAGWIAAIYLGLTILWAVLLMLASVGPFDAICHAMTTIATGGFSTSDQSIGVFEEPAVEWIVTFGMIAGSLPFILYMHSVRGNFRPLLNDMQVRWFIATLATVVLGLTLAQVVFSQLSFGTALRQGAFNATSVMTGTGYTTAEYDRWGSFAPAVFFVIMFIGGCAGSTTCGIKIFRFQILFAAAGVQLKRLVEPHGVFIAYYNRKPISSDVVESVMAFSLVYAASFALLTIILSVLGLDFLTAASGAATAISNVGPGLGDTIGPSGNFATLPDAAKWVLSAGMLFGRLEFFTLLVMLSPGFWRT